jgi:hypothetical protein
MTVKRALIYFIFPVVSSSKFIVIYHFSVSNESELAPERIFPSARLPVCAVMPLDPGLFLHYSIEPYKKEGMAQSGKSLGK